jgi:multiple sugar transport system ATP-binding protein
VTHDQVEAMTLADKIVLLHAGKDTERYGSIAQVGAPLELYHRPKSKFVAGFIGSPQMNFIAAKVALLDAQGVEVEILSTGQRVRTRHAAAHVQLHQALSLGIRPEHLELRACTEADAGQFSAVTGHISAIERLGEQTYLHFHWDENHSFVASVPGNAVQQVGERISLAVPAEHCHLFTADGRAVQPL